jgi:hypothetical protein
VLRVVAVDVHAEEAAPAPAAGSPRDMRLHIVSRAPPARQCSCSSPARRLGRTWVSNVDPIVKTAGASRCRRPASVPRIQPAATTSQLHRRAQALCWQRSVRSVGGRSCCSAFVRHGPAAGQR